VKLQRLTNQIWKQALANQDAPDAVHLAKGFNTLVEVVSQKQAEEDGLSGTLADRVLQFTISTGAVDRDGDTISPKGWELQNFRRSGSMLWAHNPFEPPIARPVATFVEDDKLKSRAVFTPPEVYEFGDTIFKMYKGGFMRATSVGFLPKKFEVSEDEDRKNPFGFPGLDFKKQELLEYSGVPVPSNPEALHEASKSIDLRPMKNWVKRMLDGEYTSLYLPREVAEELYASLKSAQETPTPQATGRGVDVDPLDPVEPSADTITVSTNDPTQDPPAGMGDVAEVMKTFCETIKEAEKAEANMLEGLVEAIGGIAKRGRVLSAANEEKLREAATLLQQVLSGVKQDDEDDDDDGDGDDEHPKGAELSFDLTPEPTDDELEVDLDAVTDIVERHIHEAIVTPQTGKVF
jgi:hypothetical protein